MTALVTPFREGEIDWAAVDELVRRQIDGGADWIVPCGTTGESPTLSRAEHERLLEAVIARVHAHATHHPHRDSDNPLPHGCGSDREVEEKPVGAKQPPYATPGGASALFDRGQLCDGLESGGTARAKARGSDPYAKGRDGSADARRCRVLAGTGSNDTAATIEKTRQAQKAGADAAMLVAPYYNRPTQEGLFRHYAAVADAVDLPLLLYNVPARTGVTITADTIARLRERYPNIIAVKDATGTVDNVSAVLSRCEIAVLCGDDALTWPMMALGAVGVISVIGNLVPHLLKSLVVAATRGDMTAALALHRRVYNLAVGLARFGPNPVPIKTAMALRGIIAEEFRLPLCALEASARRGIEELLRVHTEDWVRDTAQAQDCGSAIVTGVLA